MSPLSQALAPPLCPAAHPLLLGGSREGRAQKASQCSFFPGPFPPPFLLGPAFRGPRVGVASKAGEERTQGSLFQPRRQRAPLSTPGPSPRWVSVCEGVEPVQRGGRGGRTTEDRSPRTAPGATFAASSACPDPAPRLTVSILPYLPCSLPWSAWGRGDFSRAPGDRGGWHCSALGV